MSFRRAGGLPRMDASPPPALVVSGHVTREAVPHLCADLEALLSASDAPVVDCDVRAIAHPDLTTVEAIARLALTARRANGRRLRLRGTPPGLRALLELVGLGEVTS